MADTKYILALDQGTTSSRAILFDRDGAIAGVSQQEFPQYFPAAGQVEHEPDEIWSSQREAMERVMGEAGVTAGEIAAIGITNQRETAVVWDRKTGEPIHRAIVWQDRRTAPICDALSRDGHAGMIQKKTGLVIDPYFAGTKVQWLLDHVPGARERADRGELAFGTVDSWLVWKLTGGKRHVTDSSNACRTMLFNIHTGEWDEELLGMLRVPREILPEVASSSEVYGETSGIPIAGMAGDQHAALFGQACFSPGMAKNTYGTGCFVLWQTGTESIQSQNRLLSTVAWRLGDQLEYALEGSVFMAGATVQWLRDGLGIIRTSAEVEALAASVTDNGGVYLVPAFAGLGAPHWDAYARGMLIGITRGTTAAHLARAALESIAFQSADVLDAMRADVGEELAELRVDGGASANDLLMQFQADVLGVPVVRPRITETTALGAAYLAGLATGFWPDRDAIAHHWQAERRFEPSRPREAIDALREDWRRAIDRARDWAPKEG